MSPQLPEIEALESAIDAGSLRLTVTPGAPGDMPGRRRIELRSKSGPLLSISVDDEYGDAAGHPGEAQLLQLVLAECETWEETSDLSGWAREAGLDPTIANVQALFDELSMVVPRIRAIVGEVRAISSWDVQMNCGAARALRDANR